MRPARLLPLAFALAAGCGKPTTGPAPGGDAGPVTVKVTAPKRQALHYAVEQPGTLQPFEVTPLVAKIPGYVKAIADDPSAARPGAVIDKGSVVKAGQTLATLDVPELVEEVGQKKAMVEQAKAEWEQAKKNLAVAEAAVGAAKAMVQEADAGVQKAAADLDRWRSELAQSEDLVARRVIDTQSRDVVKKQFQAADAAKAEAAARVTAATAGLMEREARRDRVAAEIATAAAKVKVAEADARRVEAMVGYTAIKAPFAGIVTARHADPGHFVQPSGQNAMPLFVVARTDPVRVAVDVPEGAADRVKAGTAATVRVGGRDFTGAVARTTGVIRPDSRTLTVEIDLPNPDGALKAGTYALVRIAVESADATVLPAACLLPADETQYCYAVEGEKVVKLRVQTGRTEGSLVQVTGKRRATAAGGLWEPFTGKEQIVVGGLGALTDGLAVQVAAP